MNFKILCILAWLGSGCASGHATQPELIKISPNGPITLVAGDSTLISARYFDNSGNVQAVALEWRSSDSIIVSIDPRGEAHAKMQGSAVLNATYRSILSEDLHVIVSVSQNKVVSVTIDASKTTLNVGETLPLMAIAKNASNVTVTGTSTDWTSDEGDVLMVNSMGILTATGPGTANITVTIDQVKSPPVEFTVHP